MSAVLMDDQPAGPSLSVAGYLEVDPALHRAAALRTAFALNAAVLRELGARLASRPGDGGAASEGASQ